MTASQCPAKSESNPFCRTADCAPAGFNSIWLGGGSAVLDGGGRIVSVNDTLAIWLEATPGELKGEMMAELFGEHHAEWEQPLRQFLAGTAQFDRMELAAQSRSGAVKLAVEICRHSGVQFVRFESVLPPVRDLEEAFPERCWGRAATHRVFNRLVRAEAQLENLLERWPGILFSQRPDFSFAFASRRIEDLTGISADDWKRQAGNFWRIVHEADAEALMRRFRDSGRLQHGISSTYRVRHIQTGRVSYLWEHRQAVRSSNGLLLGYEGIWLDITRQTIAERRLLNVSWKESLGTLTMGLAHDFCNIMAGIVSLSDTFEAESAENETVRSGLTLIRCTATQASDLASRIRQLHQGIPGQKNYHDLNEIVSGMTDILKKVLTRRVQLQSALGAGQFPVYADEVALRQVIVNLAMNAVDAMPNGGSLTFRTSRHLQTPAVRPVQGEFPRAPLLCLSAQDTGAGIPECYVNSIFDPFFTTKPLGKGSGLGLFNARLFAENHGAAISLETREHAGTTFHFWFAEADFSETQQPPEIDMPVRHTILVAGHPGASRERIVEFLRASDFYVVPADNGPDAIEALHSPDFHIGGVVFLCPGEATPDFSLLQRVRAEKLPVKTFLALRCNQDDLETAILEKADAVLPQDAPVQEWVSRIKTVLDRS